MLRFLLLILILIGCQAEKKVPKVVENQMADNTQLTLELPISSRIDTTKSEVREVLNLYKNYINSHPDTIYDNPYWNSQEKSQYKDFDFSRVSIYNGISSNQLFRVYLPFVLSIEPKNEKYEIRVLYTNSATEAPYVGSKVWCIHKLNAIREKGDWKLENIMVEKTKNWEHKKVGFIEYVYTQNHAFDLAQVNRAAIFCNQIMRRFNPDYNDQFQFYLADGVDEMGELENFDYYFSGITTGKAREGMILSSLGDEFYPHEFIHKLLPNNENRGKAIEEGLATFLGTREDLIAYESMMKKLANDFNKRESFTLKNILNDQTEWNGYPATYPGGAMICEVVYKLKGDDGINQLARGKTNSYDEIMSLIQSIVEMKEDEVIRIIEKTIKEYQ